ncbi:GNAT family N-acetyltransferase [Haladaptatus sp. AB643]|uniref:GNAT family N-acetyltransferase n=1 Tax=unclassified Haladaptatus TaxID=2622732 RepID=UPI00209BEC4F|nr:GNAT family N-acetyltransferase [Haladaptatus sp. AB643]MCO8252668.1 GNAT family N-acetyltransferase [Haladaptatus sp. AB618]
MIRPATPDDLPRLREVRSWLSEPTPELLETTISEPGSVFVSTAANDPVGYILTLVGTDAYIAELVVEPVHRREGRARRLLQTALDSARDRGCARISLTVHEKNEAARSLYESMGFELVGRESGYYADGGDGLLFENPLQ